MQFELDVSDAPHRLGGLSLVRPIRRKVKGRCQQKRVTSFMDPLSDPRGSGYQVIQSRIAIGHGGIWGTGTAQGTQTQLRFIPVAHTDFIFSAFAEEHGFLGVMVVLGLYFLWILHCSERAGSAGQSRHVSVHGRGNFVVISHPGQYRNGFGQDDCDGNSVAADECGRIESVFSFHDAGAGEQRPATANRRLRFLNF